MRIILTLFAFILVLAASQAANTSVLPLADNFANRPFLYVNNNDFENSISAFSVSQDGRLQTVPGSPFLTGGLGGKKAALGGLCISRKGKLLFATNNVDNTLSTFKINSNGSLTLLPGNPVQTGGSFPASVACNRTGSQVFVANTNSDTVSAFALDNNSVARPIVGSPFRGGNGPTDLILNTDGTILFSSHQFSHSIGVYSVDSANRLRLVNDVASLGLSNYSLSLNAKTSRLYVAELGNSSIGGFNINLSNGALSLLPNQPYFTDGEKPLGVATSPNGQFVYASNNSTSTITVFSSNADGSLKAISGSPITTDGQGPASMVMNKKGTLLFVANGGFAGTRDISVYSVSQNGFISPISGSPFPTGSIGFPNAIALVELK
jgi:6-phosphogluconolactonase (cycloisomerase 2 family)